MSVIVIAETLMAVLYQTVIEKGVNEWYKTETAPGKEDNYLRTPRFLLENFKPVI